MKLGRFCIAIAFVFFFVFEGFAQNAVLNNCYVIHRDQDMEGKKKGIRFFLNLSVYGKKDQKVWCIIEMAYYEGDDTYYFSHSKGNFEYNGHLAVYKQLVPPYEGTTWNELQLFMPYEEIKNSIGEKDWKKGVTYCVKVVDAEGKVLLQEWQTSKRMGYTQKIYPWETCGVCRGSGKCGMCYGIGGRSFYSQGFVKCSICSGSGKCRYCKGLGRTKSPTIMSSYDVQVNNGNSSPSSYSPPVYYGNPASSNDYKKSTCVNCGGSGKCKYCGGRGIKTNHFGGFWEECPACRGTGVCGVCEGRGSF